RGPALGGAPPHAAPRRCSGRRPVPPLPWRCSTALGRTARPLLRLGLAPGRVLRTGRRLAALLLRVEASPQRRGPLRRYPGNGRPRVRPTPAARPPRGRSHAGGAGLAGRDRPPPPSRQ